jgi:hypothetical protein
LGNILTGQFTSDGQHLITLPLTFHTLIFLNMKMKYVAHDIVAYIFIKMANNNWSHGKKIIELSKVYLMKKTLFKIPKFVKS